MINSILFEDCEDHESGTYVLGIIDSTNRSDSCPIFVAVRRTIDEMSNCKISPTSCSCCTEIWNARGTTVRRAAARCSMRENNGGLDLRGHYRRPTYTLRSTYYTNIPPCLFSAELSRAVHAPRDSREVHAHHLSQNAANVRRNSFAEAFPTRRFPLVSRHLDAPSFPSFPSRRPRADTRMINQPVLKVYIYIEKERKGGKP